MLCYAMLCYAMLCYAMLCYAMLCYAMLCYAMLCYAMLCYAMLCYAMLCVLSSRGQSMPGNCPVNYCAIAPPISRMARAKHIGVESLLDTMLKDLVVDKTDNLKWRELLLSTCAASRALRIAWLSALELQPPRHVHRRSCCAGVACRRPDTAWRGKGTTPPTGSSSILAV
ncbi:MAG: hypothetical protein GPOALKHO_000901 [Sodalis sp.]|nr:MAG: hypothetical protein GPOALKHO_000901 [Sodalis sp.]